MVTYLMGRYAVGARQACRCIRLHRSMCYYRSRMDPLTALRQRVHGLARARVRFGYRRIYMLLRREGWDVGDNRFYRVYCEENLGLRRKRPWRTCRQCIGCRSTPQGDRMTSGEWILWPISWLMAVRLER